MKYLKIPYLFFHFLLLIGLCLNARSQEMSKLPNTPVGKIAQAFFLAFNSDDRMEMQEFIASRRTASALKRISLEKRMKMFDQQKKMIQVLDSLSIISDDSLKLSVLAYSHAIDSWFKLGFELSAETQLLESFLLRPGRAPKIQEEGSYGKWNNPKQLLENIVEAENIPGISLVTISAGRIDQVAVAGVREIGKPARIGKNDRFHIGSITKSMTATLVGKLIEDKKLAFETSLKEVFPEMDMLPVYDEVSIRQLLDHQGGIPAYLMVTEEEEEKLLALAGSPEEQRLTFIKQVLLEEADQKAGSFSYSNAGYTLLAVICEQISGESWEELLEMHIFGPLKMNHSGIGWPNTQDQNQPVGHFGPAEKASAQGPDYFLGPYLDPAGDIHCSMKDLAKFLIAHLKGLNGQNTILKAKTVQALHTSENGKNYAGGWMIRKTEQGQLIYEHPGSAGTFMAYAGIDPETQNGWVIAANLGDLALDEIFKEIIDLISKRN